MTKENLRRFLLFLIIFLVVNDINAEQLLQEESTQYSTANFQLHVIDPADTIVFDLANGVINAGQVEFPVYFKSDDTIQAVDFAFRFNQPHLLFDTIYPAISTLSESYYLNPGDSVLRFTSFSIPVLASNVNIAWIRFSVNALPVLAADFNSVEAYLNGYPCSYKFTDGTTMSILEMKSASVSVFPNPADRFLFVIGSTELSNVEFLDFQGRSISLTGNMIESGCMYDLTGLTSGVYFILQKNSQKMSVSRLVVNH
jgi:hypothetical protein